MPNNQTFSLFRYLKQLSLPRSNRRILEFCLVFFVSMSVQAIEIDGLKSCFSFNVKGKCQTVIEGDSAVINTKNNIIKIYRLRGLLEQESSWTIQADYGEFRSDQKILTLKGHTILTQTDKNNQKSTYKGASFQYNLNSQILTSDQQVEVIRGQQHLQAIGLKANLQTRKVNLLNHVRVVIKPDSKSKRRST